MNVSLWKSFIDCLKDPDATKSFINYYVVVTSWIRNNQHYFSRVLIEKNRLDILVDLNPNIYVVDNPDFSLGMELQRYVKNEPKNLEIFSMIIGNRLWDMVTIRGKECPNCEGDEMRYILTDETLTNNRIIFLECNSCGWTEDLDGTPWSGSKVKILPANKEDIKVISTS